jgi:hypothetical protein
MSDRIGAMWRTYRTTVIPVEAPAIQARECRRAFYAGARALLSIILAGVAANPTEEPTAQDLVMMDEIQAELDQFLRDLQAGRV